MNLATKKGNAVSVLLITGQTLNCLAVSFLLILKKHIIDRLGVLWKLIASEKIFYSQKLYLHQSILVRIRILLAVSNYDNSSFASHSFCRRSEKGISLSFNFFLGSFNFSPCPTHCRRLKRLLHSPNGKKTTIFNSRNNFVLACPGSFCFSQFIYHTSYFNDFNLYRLRYGSSPLSGIYP